MLQRRRLLQLSAAVPFFKLRSLPLKTRSLPSDLPVPKFWFGDSVRETHVCDDELDPSNLGRVYHNYGSVQGLFFYPDSYDPSGWVYLVHWHELDGQQAPPGFVEDVEESLLSFSTPATSGAPRCH